MSKEELFLMRRKKKIPLRELSIFVGCSIALLSQYENDLVNLDINKQIKYRDYILNK